MNIQDFENLKSFGRKDKIEINDHAQAVITRTLKPISGESRKANTYDFRFWILFMYNGKEYSTRSRLFPSLSKLKKEFVPYFNQRNRQTEKEKEKIKIKEEQ